MMLLDNSMRTLLESSKLLQAHSSHGWDGYGGLPAIPGAVEAAADFIRALPSDMIQPEVAVDPDGQISLEWFGAKDRIFSISFSDRGRVAYAGIDGTARWRGAEMFDGNTIHPFLLLGIHRVIS
jgi:hypothetical protein